MYLQQNKNHTALDTSKSAKAQLPAAAKILNNSHAVAHFQGQVILFPVVIKCSPNIYFTRISNTGSFSHNCIVRVYNDITIVRENGIDDLNVGVNRW